MIREENKTEYGSIKAVNSITNFSKTLLNDNDIKLCSTYNEGKSVVAEKFIRTLKRKIYKHMAAVSKNVYFDVFDYIVDIYNNTYHTTLRIPSIDVEYGSYAECSVHFNAKDAKFKIGYHVRISKYKNNFAKWYALNWSGEILVISKVKNSQPLTYVINDFNSEEIDESFYEK